MTPAPLHLGPLHPFEVALVLVLAFGPLLAAVAVVLAIRRHEEREGDGRRGPGH